MSTPETITGQITLENLEGESLRDIVAPLGEMTIIEGGPYGALVIDAWVNPPKIQGKGSIYLENADEQAVRTLRLSIGQKLRVLFEGEKGKFSSIGELTFGQNEQT